MKCQLELRYSCECSELIGISWHQKPPTVLNNRKVTDSPYILGKIENYQKHLQKFLPLVTGKTLIVVRLDFQQNISVLHLVADCLSFTYLLPIQLRCI